MFLEKIPLESPQGAQIEAHRLIICKIILMEMDRKNIRAISLRHTPGIKHKTVRKRLQSGHVPGEEQALLIHHLRLDPDRIAFIVSCLGEAEFYFTDHCTVMYDLTTQLIAVMRETLPALGGDFMPIKDQYGIIARKIRGLVVEQHRRNLERFVLDQNASE
ncbi:hypothetical protein HNO88_003866 [Novosphingobium chloroacetimidivorans]|uniref:Uncharacterized protein n=1 Tax=Novosphingobium chloroacetimidivorans TaxID=1428314 RepID=A0A7W7KCY6_9SPHN|nr:hypothetical protein [Novosphingobium chloroacetimidivorans]MBB4860522.1 hypothetical protein [Novosphingobium chloroacetimidivorans]